LKNVRVYSWYPNEIIKLSIQDYAALAIGEKDGNLAQWYVMFMVWPSQLISLHRVLTPNFEVIVV
jgi:hypothetical protein